MRPIPTVTSAFAAALLLPACTFHSNAQRWHGCTGPGGAPMHLLTTTIVSCNALVLLPFLGDSRTEQLVASATAELARLGNTEVRVVETESNNYWYAIPPLTWLLSPTVGSVSIEYRPSAVIPTAPLAPAPTSR